MLGAIAGDVVGSIYEHSPIKQKSFPLIVERSRFTDDTVLTVAIADAILNGSDYGTVVREYARRFPHAGYGGHFIQWAFTDDAPPYNSWGNSSAMRVSPVGWACETAEQVLLEAERTAAITHNHPEGVKGAQATALAVFLARRGTSRSDIRAEIERTFGYDLSRAVDGVRKTYNFDISCQGSVPESLISFLDSESFEDAIRNAISLGGDADTMASIAGAVAEAFYGGVPEPLAQNVLGLCPPEFQTIVVQFCSRYL